MAKTVEEIQIRLKQMGFYAGETDGLAGKITSEAVVAFQASKNLAQSGKVDPNTLVALFPGVVQTYSPATIRGKLVDYMLNLVKSKTVWAATVLVATLVGWVNGQFGIEVPPDVQTTVTTLISTGLLALVGVLQSAFNSPHMTTKQPAVVNQPAEHK